MTALTSPDKRLAFWLFVLAGILATWGLGEVVIAITHSQLPPQDQRGSLAVPVLGPPASPVPIVQPPPDFAERLALAGARTGDVQVVLIWNDTNDLDVRCVGPDAHDIF